MKLFVLAVIFGVSLNLSYVHGLENWIRYMSESKILKPGSDANITCDYYAKMGSYYRKWIKTEPGGNNTFNISLNDNVLNSDSRYSVKTFQSFKDPRIYRMYSLNILNVNSNDSGTYECQIYLTNGSVVSKKSSLFVFTHELVNTVLEGDDARLSCFPENYFPIFDVTWSREDLPEGSSIENNVITIPSTVSNDSGLYSCRAMFNVTDSDPIRFRTFSRRIILDVVPPLSVKTRNQVLKRPIGSNVNITCLIRSISPVNVTWTKIGIMSLPILPGKSFQTSLHDVNPSKDSLKVASLSLKNITTSFYGQYSCQVENKFERRFMIVDLVKPHTIA